MDLWTLLIFLIVIGVMFWAVRALSGAFGIPQPIVVVIQVVLVVFALVWFLQGVGAISGGPVIRFGR